MNANWKDVLYALIFLAVFYSLIGIITFELVIIIYEIIY